MRYLLALFLVMTLASCTRASRPQNEPARTPDNGGRPIEGSENQSDASRTRTRS